MPEEYTKDFDAEALEFAFWGTESETENEYEQDFDHAIAHFDRDKNWDPVYKSKNIYDAISQMLSWALCRSVENALENAKSDKYIPRMPMKDLMKELMDIYNSFKKEDIITKE